jgi:hypothetical protein
MPKFAVYYIPQEDDPFYRLGTQILGYDVRARTLATLSPNVQTALGHLDPSWVLLSRPYGFHLTIGDAIDCTWATIPLVERELTDLLGCFNPAKPFTLRRPANRTIGVWDNTLVLLYEPDNSFCMLHALITARINPLGTGSDFLRQYLAQPEQQLDPYRAQQTRLFYRPTVLDTWYPHFTLLNPYTGEDRSLMASSLAHLFDPYPQLTIKSVCLLIQKEDETSWHIYREFHR